MAIVKYPFRSPTYASWRDLDEPFNRLARLFDEVGQQGSGDRMWSPPVSVSESNDEIVITAELPGMKESDIDIELENDVLSISGEKTHEREEGEEHRYHVWERSYGSFRRTFSLPRTVSADEVSASFANGVLTVTMPKAAEAKGRKISISAN